MDVIDAVLDLEIQVSNCSNNSKKIELFSKLCWQEPSLICLIFNSCLYRKIMKVFNPRDYDFYLEELIYPLQNIKGVVCLTCDKYLRKQKMPVQDILRN